MTLLSILYVLVLSYHSLNGNAPEDRGLIREINPNFDAAKGLICYQCRSSTKDFQPLCDRSMFRLSTKQEKYNMTLLCPSYQGRFCFIHVVFVGKKHRITTRGCAGLTDVNGNEMKTGCMVRETQIVCLCETNFCNKGSSKICNKYFGVLCIIVMFLSFI